jgi:hypothetical protein
MHQAHHTLPYSGDSSGVSQLSNSPPEWNSANIAPGSHP